MRFLTSIFVPALSAASLAGAAPGTASCPTVTRTATRCSTCPVEDCVILSSVSNPAGCPREMATRTISLPCGGGGCGGGCSTQYVFPASTTTTTTTTSRSNPGGTGTCVLTVTATTYPGIRGGCKFDCGDGFCVRDDILTLPCGCLTAAQVVTRTATVCPTMSPCYNCYTGYMYTTTATDCATKPANAC